MTIFALTFMILHGSLEGKDFVPGQKYTTQSKYFYSLGQKSFPNYKITKCEYVVLRGFLKMRCLIEGRLYYKCSFSNTYYREIHVGCFNQKFTHACPDDPSFYQSCGHKNCDTEVQDITSGVGVCGEIICKVRRPGNTIPAADKGRFMGVNLIEGVMAQYRCDGSVACSNFVGNVPVDEAGCKENVTLFRCNSNSQEPGYYDTRVTAATVWFNMVIGIVAENKVCNSKCDCSNCEDEAECYNITSGIWCETIASKWQYVSSFGVCDGLRVCRNGDDEKNCSETETCEFTPFYTNGPSHTSTRSLDYRNKCSIQKVDRWNNHNLLCDDHKDQLNCTGSQKSPLICSVKRFPTTLSETVICKGYHLCDDDIDNQCIEVGVKCRIHKHRLCDGIADCPGSLDEDEHNCNLMTSKTITCTRKLSYRRDTELTFPISWIMDGIEDCDNGLDEDTNLWFVKCGTGTNLVYLLEANSNCENVALFRCPKQNATIDTEDLCKNFLNCDSSVCIASRKPYNNNLFINPNLVRGSNVGQFHCLPGIERLQNTLGQCHSQYHQPSFRTFGVSEQPPILTSKQYTEKVDCEEIFGEMYVTLACNGQCGKKVSCPLTRLTHSSCTNYFNSRTLTITDDYKLTVVIAEKDKSFRQNIFGCSNGRCIEYSHVCDLKDDCGDSSDESICSNNFKCAQSGEYIPKSMKCNRKFDCFDLTDECNADCDNQIKMLKHKALYIAAWSFGLISVILNIIVIYQGLKELCNLHTKNSIINKSFVIFISFGDLLQGIFLLTIAITDDFINKSTCITQFDWTTNSLCSAIGIISTIGSLISLYSMTLLSIIRARGMTKMTSPKDFITRKGRIHLITTLSVILILASTVAVIPILPQFEDYFVTKLYYKSNMLFAGAPDKVAHIRIIQDYFEGLRTTAMSWKQIRRLVKEMFHNTNVVGKPVGFYGMNGFCLFNYFTPPNSLQKWFSWSVLGSNLICVCIITACYSFVNAVTAKSSAIVGSHNKHVLKKNKIIQRKISILITTDLISWVPFITACLVHSSGIMGTSKMYSIFSVIILPCNSFINPIVIFDKELGMVVKKLWSFVKKIFQIIFAINKDSSNGDDGVNGVRVNFSVENETVDLTNNDNLKKL